MIEPKILKGFRDFLPDSEAVKEEMIDALKRTFRQYGFVPIDTPCLEYSEVLLRKSNGETEKQVFRFNDNGGRDVALRFDLTVPFARFIAMHKDSLYFPFKRYHIAKVWRGEKPQGGRYREFTQCDFDTIGCDSAASDAQSLLLISSALDSCGAGRVTIRVNHRGILTRFLDAIGVSDKAEDVLRAIDRLHKAGKDKVMADLIEIAGGEAAEKIMQYISAGSECKGDWNKTLERITDLAGGEGEDTKRLKEVRDILDECLNTQHSALNASYILDPSITRGLDYYTGIVFETFLDELPDIGSVCSGGRYDNLAGLYMKDKLSGVGASVGLDRLIAALDTLGKRGASQYKMDVEVFADENSTQAKREAAAASFRAAGLTAESFGETVKMGRQYAVAEKKGAKWGAFVKGEGVTLKRLATRESIDCASLDEAIKAILIASQSPSRLAGNKRGN